MTISVIKFPTAPMTDIPAMLRNVAANMEEGQYGPVRFVIALAVSDVENPTVFGWGEHNRLEALGALIAAIDTIRDGKR